MWSPLANRSAGSPKPGRAVRLHVQHRAPATERLLAEIRAPELARLRRREPGSVENVYDLVGEFALIGSKRKRIPPAQSSSDVLLDRPLRASELVGAPMQVTHLLEQRLEDLFIDCHRLRTLLAGERSPDQPVEVDRGGRRFIGRNLQRRGSARRSRDTSESKAERPLVSRTRSPSTSRREPPPRSRRASSSQATSHSSPSARRMSSSVSEKAKTVG